MANFTVVMAYFNNPGMLARQYAQLMKLPKWPRERIEYIVVDDCSDAPAEVVSLPEGWDIAYKLGRMVKKVRWNQDACRNWGASEARQPWLLLTDMDHLLPVETVTILLSGGLDDQWAYRFKRVDDQTFTPYKVHPNTWFMTKRLFDRVGGYDERLAGYYGTDGDFRNRVAKYAPVGQLDQVVIRVGREHTPDASTPREYGRKSPRDGEAITRIIQERRNLAPLRGHYPVDLIRSLPMQETQ